MPVERTVTDYYAVEVVKQIVPQVHAETKVEMVPVERVYQKMVYKPVTKKIVHNGEDQTNYTTVYDPTLHTLAPFVDKTLYSPVSSVPVSSVPVYSGPVPGPQLNTREDYERYLHSIGASDNLRYSEFLRHMQGASRGQVPDTVTGSIWDRAADGERALVRDLASSMYEMANDSRQIRSMFSGLR